MFTKELEEIIDAALADGTLTDKERNVLHKRAQAEGVDPDELDVVIDGRLAKMKKSEDWLRPTPPQQLANEKLGNVVKCPSCGAQVVGGKAVCPECGYTFSNVKANSSVEKFIERLDELSTLQDNQSKDEEENRFLLRKKIIQNKMDFISTFPVPNTRADLLEFLTMIQSRADSTGPKDGDRLFDNDEGNFSYAYWLLYTNCINKAKLSFSTDNDFAPYFEHYSKELDKTKGIIGFIRCHPTLCYIILFFPVVIIIARLLELLR